MTSEDAANKVRAKALPTPEPMSDRGASEVGEGQRENRTGFLSARGWMDEDGKHVWQAHDCKAGRSVSKLPWPTWQARGERIEPSLNCGTCGLHVFVHLDHEAPEEPTYV